MACRKWHIHLTITGSCGWLEQLLWKSVCVWTMVRRTNVVEHIVGCLERRANAGRCLLEDSPFDHCPVDRPCRPAGQGTDLGLGHLLKRSQWVEEMVERQVGNALLDLAVLDRAVAHQLDHSRYALVLPVASARFPPPSCVASILCGFP